jgi:signal recognition particle GTPase
MEKLSQIFNINYIHLEFSEKEYNAMTTPVFDGFFKGKKHTEETKQAMSEKKLGIKKSKETKEKMSKAQLGNKKRLGQKHTEETKQLMSEKAIGRKHPQEILDKISKSRTGLKNKKSRSNESRQKMSEATKSIPIIFCPHCIKSGKPHVMKRWHFDNCKGK